MTDDAPAAAAIRTRTVTWSDPRLALAEDLAMSGLDYLTAMLAGRLPGPPFAILLRAGSGWLVCLIAYARGSQHPRPC
jgi:hypothetical protein